MAYATTNATRHDVYKIMPNALGPFPKGKALGFTLEQWLAAAGTGTYIEENDNAALNLTFHNLVPNRTYSVWSHRVTMPRSTIIHLHLSALLMVHKMCSRQMLMEMACLV